MYSWMGSTEESASVVVVGGGLVGTLHAIYLARSGYHVRLYEARADMRLDERIGGRSINLALSLRGQEALREVGLEDVVLDKAIPMYGRMIHQLDGTTYSLAYGVGKQCLYSVSRRALNELLLSEVEKYTNVELIFSHKLIRIDFSQKRLILSNSKREEVSADTDFCFGCDGTFSAVRRQMDRYSGLDYSQDYTEHAYKELTIPSDNDEYTMKPNYLHIWPRHEFMLIALPNPDCSFTATLFMPKTMFAAIKDKDQLLTFFQQYFPDVIPKIGQERLVEDYFNNAVGKFVSVKCYPHYIEEGALLLGDAAHAMVPFYGQGMNAGFEDCLVFSQLLRQHEGDLHKAARQYSRDRYKDAYAICNLALYNYTEMRSHVSSTLFLLRRRLDRWLFWLFPRYFIPLYSMVTFSRIPYHTVVQRAARQDRMVQRGVTLVSVLGCVFGCSVMVWLLFHPKTLNIKPPFKF